LYTMTITLNGQLLLCLLAEQLIKIPQTELVQINTDGLTIRTPRVYQDHVNTVVKWWEDVTKLQLEAAEYKSMMIADVNSYVAVYQNGKVKRKGRYEYNVAWHQNASSLVVPKVAEKVLIEGAPIRQTIEQWPDIMDFMLRVKVPRSSHLLWGEDKVQNTTRYYVAKGGKPLTKVMPPLKGKTEWRRINVESGWAVQVCNDMDDAALPVDFDWYVQETEKLCLSLA
jgi:(2Fe-2S) ferredoxin